MADITISQEITVELDGNSPFEYIVVKEGDKGSRILAINLLQNKQPYTIPAGCTARVKYFKPDGNPVLNDCTISGNKILMTYTAQMLAAAGTAKGEIALLKQNQELKSATFYTKIVSQVYKTEGLVSDKEFLSFSETLVEMNQAADAAAENASIAETAAGNANTKASAANTAASSANSAATKANSAATAANNAATAANNAAASVNEAKNAATTAAGTANTAASNANAKATAADTAAKKATEAAKNAEQQAEAAAQAAGEVAAAEIQKVTQAATAATQSANTAAGKANTATTAAQAAADACEGIAAGINTIPDLKTGYIYSIGIENGKMYLERAES